MPLKVSGYISSGSTLPPFLQRRDSPPFFDVLMQEVEYTLSQQLWAARALYGTLLEGRVELMAPAGVLHALHVCRLAT